MDISSGGSGDPPGLPPELGKSNVKKAISIPLSPFGLRIYSKIINNSPFDETHKLEELSFLEKEVLSIKNNMNNPEFTVEKKRILKQIRKQKYKIDKYEQFSAPPFISIIESVNENIGNLHPMNLGKMMFEAKVEGIKKIERMGRNRVGVEFHSPDQANNILHNQLIKNRGLKIYIPQRMLTCKGLVKRIGSDITEEDLIEQGFGIRGHQRIRIVDAHQFNRKISLDDGKTEFVPSNTYLITFAGNLLPTDLEIFNNKVEVITYIYPTILCRNCLRFGHRANNCRGKYRCGECGQNHNQGECSSTSQGENRKCINCEEIHSEFSKSCQEFIRQTKINEARAKYNISFYEANLRFPKKSSNDNVNFNNFPDTLHQSSLSRSPIPQNRNYSSIAKKRKPSPVRTEGFNKKEHRDQLFTSTPRSSFPPINFSLSNQGHSEGQSNKEPTNREKHVNIIEQIIYKDTSPKKDEYTNIKKYLKNLSQENSFMDSSGSSDQ